MKASPIHTDHFYDAMSGDVTSGAFDQLSNKVLQDWLE